MTLHMVADTSLDYKQIDWREDRRRTSLTEVQIAAVIRSIMAVSKLRDSGTEAIFHKSSGEVQLSSGWEIMRECRGGQFVSDTLFH